MKKKAIGLIVKILNAFNLKIIKDRNYNLILQKNDALLNYKRLNEFIFSIETELTFKVNYANLISNPENIKSQLLQDIMVLKMLDFKKNGYFIEFGATNGFELSNTYLLEKQFGWNGILAEPGKVWQKDLRINRNCNIETDCVWIDSSSILTFNEVDFAEFSTILDFSDSDGNSNNRRNGTTYQVKTISLNDLLEKYNAPKEIDYLSIDTEGSEFDILNSFDFTKYKIKIITCEHNFSPQREKIYKLLLQNGFERKYSELSKWDDWYFNMNS
jgi:FkbM family methyltransferase